MDADFTNTGCEEFIRALASASPAPGGGGAAALVGAVGTALGSMVGSLTLGKKKYAGVEGEITALIARAAALQRQFLDLVRLDAEAFEPLSRAYRLPAGTLAEKEEKARVMEDALLFAAGPPLSIMEKCGEALLLLCAFEEKGAALAVSDAGCGAACCRAALSAAALNVFANTRLMQNKDAAAELNRKTNALLYKHTGTADGIYARVTEKLTV